MKTIVALILLVTVLYAREASAQCATGVDTGGQCISPEALAPQGNNSQQENLSRPPRAIWCDRWGAIAEDPQASAVGTITQQESESKAETAALSICNQNGGRNCKIALTYYNQCASVAVDEQNLAVHARAPTKEKAEQIALDGLGKGHTTKIVYSACSLPVRIQ